MARHAAPRSELLILLGHNEFTNLMLRFVAKHVYEQATMGGPASQHCGISLRSAPGHGAGYVPLPSHAARPAAAPTPDEITHANPRAVQRNPSRVRRGVALVCPDMRQ